MKNDKYFTRAEFIEELKKNPVPYVVVGLMFLALIIAMIVVLPYQANDPMPVDHSIRHLDKGW